MTQNPFTARDPGVGTKAVRLHACHEDPVVEEVPEPQLSGPLDVIVKVGGAGVRRIDLHIIEGQWDELQHPSLPYTIGHENAGWVHEVGPAVTTHLSERGVRYISVDGWRAIDAAEIALGETTGRARTTLHDRDVLLELALRDVR